jgi:hypothetical protein
MSDAHPFDLPSMQSWETASPHASNSTGEPEGIPLSNEEDLIQRTTLIIDSLTGDMEKDLAVIRGGRCLGRLSVVLRSHIQASSPCAGSILAAENLNDSNLLQRPISALINAQNRQNR